MVCEVKDSVAQFVEDSFANDFTFFSVVAQPATQKEVACSELFSSLRPPIFDGDVFERYVL